MKPDQTITTTAAAEMLGVSTSKVLQWLRAGQLRGAGTYRNPYGGESYLLDRTEVAAPETHARLADEIAAFQRRSARAKQAAAAAVARQRERHEAYLADIAAAATGTVREVLTVAYYLWLLNHQAKLVRGVERSIRYAMKDRTLAALWGHARVRTGVAVTDGLVVPLHESEAATICLGWVRSHSEWRGPRDYLSFRLSYEAFTFPFHAPRDNVTDWLPAAIGEALPLRDWEDDGLPFTFGGRVASWVEVKAVPFDEVSDWLTAWWTQRTGRPVETFSARLPLQRRRQRRDWDWDDWEEDWDG
jgi:excisionase family DNA binding protein